MAEKTKLNIRTPRTDDRPLWDVIFGLYGYPALLLAHKLKVFSLLADGARPLSEICDALKIKERPAEAILTVATALGFLSFTDKRYSLTVVAEDYLLEKSPKYFGFFWDLIIENNKVYSFESMEKAVLTDSPQAYGGGDIFKTHEEQVELVRRFIYGMHSIDMPSALIWPGVIDLSKHRVMLDINGSSGAHSIGAVLKLPDLKAIVLDFPQVCKLTQEFIDQSGLQDRITASGNNIWTDPWPSADLHFYSNVYHHWPPEKCTFLTEKSFANLKSGGRIIIDGTLYNDEKTGSFSAAAFSMIMMCWTEGRQYSGLEISSMLKDAGFCDIQVHPTSGYSSMVTGLKS